MIDGEKQPLVKKIAKESSRGDEFDFLLFHDTTDEDSSRNKCFHDFPDGQVANEVLNRLGLLKESGDFRELRDIRNHLPLTHGKIQPTTSTIELVTKVPTVKITRLVEILSSLVTAQEKNLQTF